MLCAHCQRQFTPDNSGLDSPARVWRGRPRQYCSDRCRVQAHRARQRAQGVPRPTTKSADPQRELLHDAREVARDLVAAAAAARSALAGRGAAGRPDPDAAAAHARHAAELAAALTRLAESLGGPDPAEPPQTT